nr:DUF3192 domain-containing protein [Gemmatimonadaceae bacterium]
VLAASGALIVLAACGPSDIGAAKLKGLEHGTPRATVLERIGNGQLSATGPDAMRIVNGHMHQVFLSKGERYEVVWYRETPGALTDSLTKETVTPIVFHADTLEGWGWKYFDKRSAEVNLPHPARRSPTAPAPEPTVAPAPAPAAPPATGKPAPEPTKM